MILYARDQIELLELMNEIQLMAEGVTRRSFARLAGEGTFQVYWGKIFRYTGELFRCNGENFSQKIRENFKIYRGTFLVLLWGIFVFIY